MLFDIAGAEGHLRENKPTLLNENTWRAFTHLQDALAVYASTNDPARARTHYLAARAADLGIDLTSPESLACAVIACMTRCFEPADADRITEVFFALPQACQDILTRALTSTGIDDVGILLYYAPATLCACVERSIALGEHYDTGLRRGLHTLARLYQQVYCSYTDLPATGNVTVMIRPIAQLATEAPERLSHMEFKLDKRDSEIILDLQPKCGIVTTEFPQVQSLTDLPGTRIAVIGIGGGSDGLQASVLGKLFKRSGKEVLFTASIRTKKTGSQGATTSSGSERVLTNHGGEPFPGVYSITSDTRGTGRFLEYLCAAEGSMYQISYASGDAIHKQVQFLINHCGPLDTLYLVDTGGDALCSATVDSSNPSQTTPDQDLYVLHEATKLSGVRLLSCILACGVDAPDESAPRSALQTLHDASASLYSFTPDETALIIDSYEQFEAQHQAQSGTRFLGKTPLALLAALNGQQGYTCLNIASSYVLDKRNPWQPYVYIDGRTEDSSPAAMAGCFFMDLANHLQSIGHC